MKPDYFSFIVFEWPPQVISLLTFQENGKLRNLAMECFQPAIVVVVLLVVVDAWMLGLPAEDEQEDREGLCLKNLLDFSGTDV